MVYLCENNASTGVETATDRKKNKKIWYNIAYIAKRQLMLTDRGRG